MQDQNREHMSKASKVKPWVVYLVIVLAGFGVFAIFLLTDTFDLQKQPLTDYIAGLNGFYILLLLSLIAAWYVAPHLAKLPRQSALQILLLVQTFRHYGMMFLAEGATLRQLPPEFAYPAGLGDLTASVLALLSLVALRSRWSVTVPLLWILTVEGIIDLVNAVSLGLTTQAPLGMGASYWIPTLFVPAMFVSHYLILQILLRSDLWEAKANATS